MRNPGVVLSRDQLLDGAWDLAFERRSNVIDVYVRYLRGKIGQRRRSRPCAASATGCGQRRERTPDPRPADACLRVAMSCVIGAMAVLVYLRVGGALLTSVDQTLQRAGARVARPTHTTSTDSSIPTRRAGGRSPSCSSSSGTRLRSTAGYTAAARPAPTRSASARGRALLPDGRRCRDSSGDGACSRFRCPAGRRDRRRAVARPSATTHSTASARELLIAGPLAVLLASLAGYGLAAAALRPVEAMRRRAAVVSAATPGMLPVPPAPRRDLTARGDAQRDALAAASGARARAAIRR